VSKLGRTCVNTTGEDLRGLVSPGTLRLHVRLSPDLCILQFLFCKMRILAAPPALFSIFKLGAG